AQVPAFVTLVGVFVDCDAEQVNNYASQISLDIVQLHGAESEQYAAQLNTPYIKAIRAKSPDQVAQEITQYSSARALLFDPYVRNQHGGTGQQLNPDLWPVAHKNTVQRLILAGGLSADNLLTAVAQFSPYAVDLNSGVEDSAGIKNIDQVAQCLRMLNES
ncbi:UNVERIFIED_CONTAM: hypothetical protein GTU68_040269, partial [Idotea baltica]|nr:hypothetical protein [Idotea baltica]